MDSANQLITSLRNLLLGLLDLIFAGINAVEVWLRAELAQLGVGSQLQTVILVVVAVLIFLAAIRLLGGVIRVLIVIFLILVVIHMVAPMTHP
jgi:hypothetical protein